MKTNTLLTCAAILMATLLNGFSQPTLQFGLTSYTVAESAETVTLTVQRLGDTNSVVGVDYATVDGTATNGLKYLAVSNTLAFAAGVTNQFISVPILADGLVQGTRNFRVILSDPTGGAILGVGASTNATVSITDNDVGVQFQFTSYSVVEDAGTVRIAVVRGDDGTNSVSVDLTTSNLTGTSGVDYFGITNNLAFAPQERLRFISIPILNNTVKQGNRTFRVTLSNPVGLTLGSQKTTTVTIVDNDQGFAFEFAGYSVGEDAGVARINVRRGTDETNSAVTVDYATSDPAATNGLDYTGLTNTLAFEPGARLKQVTVPILNDGVKEPNKNFRVTLSNPSGGAVLGSRTTATVTIVDNDPGIGFELSSYSVWENAGNVTVTVLRGNDMALGPITVDFATSNRTAVAGTDFQAISGPLSFGQNETVKTLTIPILRDALVTNDTSFTVSLSNPTGGAALGTASTTVNIQNAPEAGDFHTVAPPFDTALSIRRDGNVNVLSWAGVGQLQRADAPTGPWQTLLTATNPYTVQSPIPTTYYRVPRPRPVNLYVPTSYNGQTNVPLVILLHHYSGDGAEQENYMHFRPLSDARGFLYCYPDGLADQWGNHPWNGTDACCDFGNTGIDDAGYLRSLIGEIGRQFAVDRKRVYLIGGSAGGFMSYRMACQSADLIAGIASLAGTTFLDSSRCAPSESVNILEIRGTADATVRYWGGATTAPNYPANMPPFPGALQAVQTWAGYNGASDPVTDTAPTLDLTTDVAGLDTVVTRYTTAPPGGAVELWAIIGGSHAPTFSSQFSPLVIDWLLTHPKP